MHSFMSSSQFDDVPPDVIKLVESPNVLESCINFQPIGHTRIKPFPLSDLNDLNIQEALIVKDLLFVLLGNEGFYIRFSDKYDPSSERSRIIGPDFKIAKHLDVSLKGITKRLVKYGKYYSGLNSFICIYNQDQYGKINQSLCYQINEFLNTYQAVVFKLENEFMFNSNFNLRELETILINGASGYLNHLYEIVSTICEENDERAKLYSNKVSNDFNNFINSIENDLKETGTIDLASDNTNFAVCKGGLVIKIIQDRINTYKGDSLSYQFLTNLLDSISVAYVKMLNDWLMRGEINDPYNEFFIKQNSPSKLQKFIHSNSEKYWDEMFMTRKDGLINQFYKRDIQTKILHTGKYLNILKECGLINLEQDFKNEEIQQLTSNDLELKINKFYDRSNKLILKLFFDGYKLNIILKLFHKMFLLSDFNNFNSFINMSFIDLKKNKKLVSSTKLSKNFNICFNKLDEDECENDNRQTKLTDIKEIIQGYMNLTIDHQNYFDSSLEILNVKSFDAQEALKSRDANSIKILLNKSLETNDRNTKGSQDSSNENINDLNNIDEYTITGLNLDLKLPFPLNLIITQNFILQYQLIFKLLINVQFISKLINNTWKEVNCSYVWTFRGFDSKTKKWILRCRILHDRMKDFLLNLQVYLNFDIIETNWNELNLKINGIGKYVDIEEDSTQVEDSGNMGTNRFRNGNAVNGSGNLFGGSPSINNYNNPFNNVFNDVNIKKENENKFDIKNFSKEIESFLNNILKNTLLTNKDLIELVKSMFNLLIQYNNYLNNLKKSLILINLELFKEFNLKYPEKFKNKEINEDKIKNRFNVLNSSLNTYYEFFNNYLSDFINGLKYFGELENSEFLILVERLENCFPE